MTTIAETTSAMHNIAGKYLTFTLNRESYGIAVLKVREIIRLQTITPVPQMPNYIKGVLNLRGKIIPVIDLRLKFGLNAIEDTDETCIVVVQVQASGNRNLLMGIVVDAVEEVVSLTGADIENTPEFGTHLDTAYILGMAKIKGAVKSLLDIDRIICAEELAHSSLQ